MERIIDFLRLNVLAFKYSYMNRKSFDFYCLNYKYKEDMKDLYFGLKNTKSFEQYESIRLEIINKTKEYKIEAMNIKQRNYAKN